MGSKHWIAFDLRSPTQPEVTPPSGIRHSGDPRSEVAGLLLALPVQRASRQTELYPARTVNATGRRVDGRTAHERGCLRAREAPSMGRAGRSVSIFESPVLERFRTFADNGSGDSRGSRSLTDIRTENSGMSWRTAGRTAREEVKERLTPICNVPLADSIAVGRRRALRNRATAEDLLEDPDRVGDVARSVVIRVAADERGYGRGPSP